MKDVLFKFEALVRRQIRAIRDLAANAQLIGYTDQDGDTNPLKGDEFGPYIHPMGRASSDGETGAVSVADGEPQLLLTDEFGRLWWRDSAVATEISIFSTNETPVNGAGVSVKATAGRIYQARMIMEDPAAAVYLMIFNKTTAPVNNDVPIWRALLPDPGGAFPGEVQDNWEDIGGLPLSLGIGAAVSSTPDLLTLVAVDHYFHITYR